MKIKNPHVLVVGGGIGGLCLAQGLKKAGIPVSVFERDRSRTERLQGYRIHIDPTGSAALAECLPESLFDLFLTTCGKPGRGFKMMSHRMSELIFMPANPEEMGKIGHHSASRITLRQILLADLEANTHFDKRFSHYTEQPDGRVTAFFEDGTSETGDLLVGADGVNSRVRKQLLPTAQLLDTGVLGIAGKVPLTNQFDRFDCATMISGPVGDGMFVARQDFPPDHAARLTNAPMGIGGNERGHIDGEFLFDNTKSYLFWAYSAKRDRFPADILTEPVDRERLLAVVRGKIADWHPFIRSLVDSTEISTLASWKIRSAVPIEPWRTGPVTLLGDAIHSMTPFRGIGANTALRDAQTLCRRLAEVSAMGKDLLAGVHDYEAEMLNYGFAAVRTSLEALEQVIKERSPSEKLIRGFTMRAVNRLPQGIKSRMFSR